MNDRPVEALKPIIRTDKTGRCSRCGYLVKKPGKGVTLQDGRLAHAHHFHGRDIELNDSERACG